MFIPMFLNILDAEVAYYIKTNTKHLLAIQLNSSIYKEWIKISIHITYTELRISVEHNVQ